jgi:transposase InsO family protein
VITYVLKARSELYACYENFRRQALNIFRTDIHTVEYNGNEYDPEIKALQAGNAKEYHKPAKILWERYGARTQFTMTYTPQQNGVAERRMRTSMEHFRALFFDGNLPRVLWAVCIRHVTDLLNMTPSVSTNQRTPYELWHNRKPTVIHLRVFGCKAPIHVPKNGETSWIPVQPSSCTWAYLIKNVVFA